MAVLSRRLNTMMKSELSDLLDLLDLEQIEVSMFRARALLKDGSGYLVDKLSGKRW